jgi:hypothetical protein
MLLEDCPKLTAHLPRIANYLTDDITLKCNVIPRAVQRDSHAATRALGGDNPRMPDVTCVTCCHNLARAALADAPFGGACRINYSLELITT